MSRIVLRKKEGSIICNTPSGYEHEYTEKIKNNGDSIKLGFYTFDGYVEINDAEYKNGQFIIYDYTIGGITLKELKKKYDFANEEDFVKELIWQNADYNLAPVDIIGGRKI